MIKSEIGVSHKATKDEEAPKAELSDTMEKNTLITTNTVKQKRITKKSRLLANEDFKRWYDNRNRSSKNCAEARLRHVSKFCEDLHITPMGLIDIGLKSEKTIADVLQDYITMKEEEGKAPQYIKSIMTAVKSWLAHHDIFIRRKLMISNPEDTPTLAKERVFEKEEMKELFVGATLRQGTIMSFLSKCGLRPQSIGSVDGSDGLMLQDFPDLALVDGQWRFLKQPPRVVIRKNLSKARHEYFSYMTPLAQLWFLAYLNERMANNETLNPTSPAVSPMKASPFSKKYTKGRFMKTAMVSRDVREAMRPRFSTRPYLLRGCFRTSLAIAEADNVVSHSLAEFWFAHRGDISARYSLTKGVLPKQLLDKMEEAFLKCVEYIDIEKEILKVNDMEETTKEFVEGLSDMLESIRDKKSHRRQKSEKPKDEPTQRVVTADESVEYLGNGWEFVATLPNEKVIIRKGVR